MNEPGRVLASGRDADILEYGPGKVLRRTRTGRSIEAEARIMQHVAEQGYPVPAIYDVLADGAEIVMERIDGPLMLDAAIKPPWKLPRAMETLADLHDQLAAVPPPDWLRRTDLGGDHIVHLDLHPLNVIMSARGPVVIDWANAIRGEPLFDAALTYVLLTCPDIPAPVFVRVLLQPLRRRLGHMFAKRWWGPELDAQIVLAAELKTLDVNISPVEAATMLRLAEKLR
jgi:aminoglycoside phosphotransferase (APT) family kinase protein